MSRKHHPAKARFFANLDHYLGYLDREFYAWEMKPTGGSLVEFVDGLKERLCVLESRTVTVKLPPRVDISNVPFTAHTWNCCLDAVEKCLAAAGIQVIEGE